MECRAAVSLIDAKLDGELAGERLSALDAHLASCAECRARLAAGRALGAAIRDHARRDAAPAELRRRVATALRQAGRPRWHDDLRALGRGWNPMAIAASIALAVVVSSTVTRDLMRPGAGDPMVRQVVGDHIRSLMADHLTDVASSDRHTVKPWFNGRVDVAPPVADLAAAGFPLVGGRLDYLGDRPAAALVYRRDKHVINVLVTPADLPGPAAAAYRGYNLIRLDAGGLGLWIVSDLNATELRDFADRLRAAAAPPAQP
jgi:anti-sigma factor RsiW